MGVLANLKHEKFCQSAHKRIWAGEKQVAAYHAAYREAIYEGDNPADKAIASNVRKVRNRVEVKARLTELAQYAAILAGTDAGWAMRQLKSRVNDFNLDDYLSPGFGGQRFFDIANATREQLGRLAEMTIEEDIIEAGEDTMRKVRKIKIKPYDPASIIGLMARIAGWEAPKLVAMSGSLSISHEDALNELDEPAGAGDTPDAAE